MTSTTRDDHALALRLAALRPGDEKRTLAAAMAPYWREPAPEDAGRIDWLRERLAFTARLGVDGRIAWLDFGFGFDERAPIAGLRLKMPESEIERIAGLRLSPPSRNSPYRYASVDLPGGGSLSVTAAHGRATEIFAVDPAAVTLTIPSPLPPPALAYDVEVKPGLLPRGAAAPDGWCCGLPRGISPTQWPLSGRTGFPLEHYFTVRVPEPYRVKGERYVALAFFGETWSESRKSPAVWNVMETIFDGRPPPLDVDDGLRPFVDHLRRRHPMEFRCKDILEQNFAAIWLAAEEFAGGECEPPALIKISANAMCAEPPWLKVSAAQRLFGHDGREAFDPAKGAHRRAGRPPRDRWEALALSLSVRQHDPNVGRAPIDDVRGNAGDPDGYAPISSPRWEALAVKPPVPGAGFGGTAVPAQGMPELTPFFMAIGEELGEINMGGGNGQLDLVSMRFDWAQ